MFVFSLSYCFCEFVVILLAVVIDDRLYNALRLFAVAYKLTLRHIDSAVVLADGVGFPFFACSGVLSDGNKAFAALIVECGVWHVRREADTVWRFACLNRTAQGTGDDQKGASRVRVTVFFPAFRKERLALEVLIKFLCKFDAEVGNDVFFERFWVEHCIFLQKVLVIEIKVVLLQCSIGITLRDPLLFFFFIKWF